MSHPLQARVCEVGRRARQLRLVERTARSLALFLSAAALAGLADYLVRIEDLGFRALLSGVVFMAAAYGLFRWIYPVWADRLADIETG
jgi:hypothetical protein